MAVGIAVDRAMFDPILSGEEAVYLRKHVSCVEIQSEHLHEQREPAAQSSFAERPQPAGKIFMKRTLIIAGALLVGPAHAAPSPWLQEQTENMHRITGPFVSTDFGFSIKAPPEATEYVTNGSDANHGPIVILGEGRKITVYPEYTGFTAGDAQPCRRNQFPWESGSKKVPANASLSRRHACIMPFIQGSAIWRIMQTARTDRGTGIMYTLLLTTTAQWSREDFFSFRRVADSFRQVPISP